jgi:hypothetical protein
VDPELQQALAHNRAQTFEVRARGTSAAVREFDERLGLIEERVAKIERSRNWRSARWLSRPMLKY